MSHHTHVTIHVRDVARSKLVAVVTKLATDLGAHRVRMAGRGMWQSVAVEEVTQPDVWARGLSKGLRCEALGVWYGEGESTFRLVAFSGGKAVGEIAVPENARNEGRHVVIALGALSRYVRNAAKDARVELRIAADVDDGLGEAGDLVYVSREMGERAFCRAFGLDRLFLDPDVEDDDERDDERTLELRASIDAANTAARAREDAQRRVDVEGRVYAVGWLGFDTKGGAISRVLRKVVAPLVTGFRAQLPDGTALEGNPFDAATLARDRGNELVTRDPILCSVWGTTRDGALQIGFSFRGFKDPTKRAALTDVMLAAFDAAVLDAACFGALLTAQRTPTRLSQQALAYDYYRDRSALAIRPASFRTRARAPGHRLMVPSSVGIPARGLPEDFVRTKTTRGVIVASRAADPWDTTQVSLDALERALAAAF